IIRHVLPGGRSILSFYGHLDPPSVTLRRGACVARGEQVGAIGDPRGRPHLHFEIRDHTPADPGPGYWYENPVLGGWYPPSQTIWASRYGASPGVLWARPPEDDDFFPAVAPVGFLPDGVLVLLEAGRLVGVGSADGGVRWRQPEPVVPTPTPGPDGARPDATRMALQVVAASPVAAVLDDAAPVVYTVDRRGRLQAHATEGEVPVFDPLWQVRLNMVGTPALAPLPGGGVVVVGRRSLVATNAGGAELWRAPLEDWAGEAVRAGDRLFLPVGRGETVLWELTQSGATPLPDLPAGTPVGRPGGLLWLYARDGVYHLNPQQNRATLAKALPPALYGAALRRDGGALALPDGGLLVAHPDLYDSRLLRLDPRGALIWERSYRAAGAARAAGASGGRALAQLAFADGRPFLAVVEEGPTMLVTVYAVDLDSGNLERLFVGGARGGNALNTWLIAAPDGLLLNIGGGHLVALDPPAALDALRAAR
ncbi:MAG: M23 family metallopeptidase, partial [Candidatus Promineifilaceae bacterium]|nr:M23 family metallopeptidase [Candidatus Promineifilaceae bacterium]